MSGPIFSRDFWFQQHTARTDIMHALKGGVKPLPIIRALAAPTDFAAPAPKGIG